MSYIKGKLAQAQLGVCANTLRKLADNGTIESALLPFA